MIKINKVSCPNELTFEKQRELTHKYIETRESVWKESFIRQSLLISSHSKCVYCECELDVESKYMEVEHFHDKNHYPLEVVNWNNLLPSCKRCNGNKSTFDTKINPFINPAEMDPRDHLVLTGFRFFPVTEAGNNTINALLLNDPGKLVKQRFEIVNTVLESLNLIYENVSDYHNYVRRTTNNKNRFISALDNLLEEGMPNATYSATVATELINSPHLSWIVDILCSENLWNDELQIKINKIFDIALDTELDKTMVYKKKKNTFETRKLSV